MVGQVSSRDFIQTHGILSVATAWNQLQTESALQEVWNKALSMRLFHTSSISGMTCQSRGIRPSFNDIDLSRLALTTVSRANTMHAHRVQENFDVGYRRLDLRILNSGRVIKGST